MQNSKYAKFIRLFLWAFSAVFPWNCAESRLQFKIQNFFIILSFIFGFWILLFGFSFVNAQVIYEGTNVPYIHPRAEWLTTPELKNLFNWYPYNSKPEGEIPDYYPIRQIILHDTGCNPARAGCNDESVPTPTLIQNMFRLHAVTRGWGDIGYHFIIDRKGHIWEGRYGGLGVRGAHLYDGKTCQNFNVGSIGITLLGNYYNAQIPQVMRESLEKLVAWIAATTNLDLSQTITIPIWTNQKDEKGKCVVNNSGNGNNEGDGKEESGGGGFTTSFTGPVLLTHRDIEPANSDIRNINLAVIKTNTLPFISELKSYVYQGVGQSNFYQILNGSLKAISEVERKVVKIIATQLDFFRPELFARKPEPKVIAKATTFLDGSLLKVRGAEEVYLIKNQKRLHISSAALFNGLGFRWEDIQEVDSPLLTALPLEKSILFPDNVLIKSDPPDVYLIKGGKRYLISSADLFNVLGFKWEDIIPIALSELDRYPWGGYVIWPEGTVLQNQYNKAQVFVLKEGKLQSFDQKLTLNTPLRLVTGRELASYQSAQVASPGITLSPSEVLEKIKNTFGIASATSLIPLIIPQESGKETVTPPTIKIALCKNRDVANCAFNVQEAITIKENGDGTVTVQGYEDHPGFNPSLNDNIFRGKVSITASSDEEKVWLINELSLEDYLKGIAETLASDAKEYRKGLIIMARTYAYYYLTQDRRHPDKPFDLNNTSFDQLYRGYNYEKRSGGLQDVVEETKGQIVTFEGKPIVAAYSSDSGGVTKDACTVWVKYCGSDGKLKPEFAYLKGGATDPEGTVHEQEKIKASHGAGVSTTGARRLIELGKKFDEMVKYYYPGVEIQKVY